MSRLLPLCLAIAALAGCDQLGIESHSAVAERKLAEGKAVGAACRHAGRAIEDCYTLNPKPEKAAIYAGWREMDDYMRENKLEPVPPKAQTAEGHPAEEQPEEEAEEEKASPAKTAKLAQAGQQAGKAKGAH